VMANEGYESVSVRLPKSRCASTAQYIETVAQVCSTLPERPIVVGHSLAGGLAQQMLSTRRVPERYASHWPMQALLLCPVPAMLPATYFLFLLRLLFFEPIGLLLSALFVNPAYLVGGGDSACCRSLNRATRTLFTERNIASTTLPVPLESPALPIEDFHLGMAQYETFAYILTYLIFGFCRSSPANARVAIVGSRDDRIVRPWMHARTVRWWGEERARSVTVAGQGHMLGDAGWEHVATQCVDLLKWLMMSDNASV